MIISRKITINLEKIANINYNFIKYKEKRIKKIRKVITISDN